MARPGCWPGRRPRRWPSALLSVVRTPALRERLRKTALAAVQERTWERVAAPARLRVPVRAAAQRRAGTRAGRLERGREGQRDDPLCPGLAQLAADHGQRPPRAAAVVEQDAGAGRGLADDAKGAADVGGLLHGVGHLGLGRACLGPLQQGQCRHAELRCHLRGQALEQAPRRTDGTEVTQATWPGPAPRWTRADRVGQRSHDLILKALAAQAPLHRRPPAAVAEAGQRPPGLDADVLGDLAHRARRVGGHLLDLELDRRRAQVAAGQLHQRRVGRRGEAGGGADRAAAAVLGLRIVELRLQHAHEAAPVGAEALHRPLLLAAQRGDARVALPVIAPVRVLRQDPARAVAAQRPLDVEDLEHRLQPAAADVDDAEQLLGAAAAVPGGAQVVEHRRHALA